MLLAPDPQRGASGAGSDSGSALERAYRVVVESLPVAVLVTELDGRIVMANTPAAQLFGFDGDELANLELDELFPEQLRDRYRQLHQAFLARAREDSGVLRGERVIRTQQGRELSVDVAVRQLELEGKRQLLWSALDLTESKRIEQDTLEQLHALFEHAKDGVFVLRVTQAGEFLYEAFSSMILEWTGLTGDGIRGRSPYELWPADADAIVRNYRLAVELGEPHSYEESIGEGSDRRTFRTTLIPIRAETGRVHRIVGIAHDLTRQMIAETVLAHAELALDALWDQAFQLVALLDTDGRLLRANRTALELVGADPSDVLGRYFWETRWWSHSPEQQALARTAVEKATAGELVRYEATHVARDGSLRFLDVSLKPLRDERGTLLALLHEGRDVTERHQAERARTELEHRARQAQKLEALGTLAGGIAHDFNNILGAIVAYAELVELDADDPSQVKSHVSELRRASSRARDLVQQILTFSRQQKQERRPIRIDAAIREALKLVRSTLPSTIQIETQIAPELPLVLADLTQIHQVLLNLATNSAHAMSDRPGQLTVRLDVVDVDAELARKSSELQPRKYARLRVTDTGRGMPPETLKRVFEPFFTTKAVGEGTGLGLAVIQGIVQEHEGTISVQSEVDRGTTFELLFPEHSADFAEGRAPAAELVRGQGESVLFVDDEVVLCSSVARLLERLGYRVTACSKPLEALALVRAEPSRFEVVLTDLTMPQMTGLDLAREIQELSPRMPVLIMSGFSGTWSSDSLRSMGIYDLVAKPLSANALAAAVGSAIRAGK